MKFAHDLPEWVGLPAGATMVALGMAIILVQALAAPQQHAPDADAAPAAPVS